MSTKRKVLTGSAIIVFLVTLILGVMFIPSTHFDFEAEEVSRITIFDGSTGEQIEIKDEVVIIRITENINSVEYKRGGPDFNSGYTYDIKLYDQDNDLISQLTVRGDSKITYNRFAYIAKEGSIDYDYIESLFEE